MKPKIERGEIWWVNLDLGMRLKQSNRRIHRIRKTQCSRGIRITDAKGFVLEIPLELLTLSQRNQRLPPARFAINPRIRAESFLVQGVVGPVKPLSTSAWSQATR